MKQLTEDEIDSLCRYFGYNEETEFLEIIYDLMKRVREIECYLRDNKF